MMRIITGRARGAHLRAPSGTETRPTAERTKEAVFSILGGSMPGARVLDLFAGSGQLGLEALSRGAERAVFCDRSREAAEVIKANLAKTRLEHAAEVYMMDWSACLRRLSRGEGFDLVFLDPPYAKGLLPEALRELTEKGLLRAGARVVCESREEGDVFDGDECLAARFAVLRATHYGIAHVTVLQVKAAESEEEEG